MTLRAIGAYNGILPEPTGILNAFLRDPARAPHRKYVQFVPAPEINYLYARLDPDEAVRMVDLNAFAWGYDDYRPTGRGFTAKVEWINNTTQRWDFPWQLGNATNRVWGKQGLQPRQIFDRLRANHASLHRSVRVVNALSANLTGANTASLNTLMGTTGAFFDLSSGVEYDPSTGVRNVNFLLIKKAFQRVKRRLNLLTNAALTGEELVAVMPPIVAEAIAASGEGFEAKKQWQTNTQLTDPIIEDWNLPPKYAGFTLVVEDTPRCFINQHADGTVADVTVPNQKDYLLNTDTIYFLSRPGGLTGEYGQRNFSTIQCFHYNGEARVEAFSEPKHDLVEGHVVMEDRIEVPAAISGFALTDVLST